MGDPAGLAASAAREGKAEPEGSGLRVQAVGSVLAIASAPTTRKSRESGFVRTEVTMDSHSHCSVPEGNRDCLAGFVLRSWCVTTSGDSQAGAATRETLCQSSTAQFSMIRGRKYGIVIPCNSPRQS